jgi:DNA-binding transcriptional MerR regulator
VWYTSFDPFATNIAQRSLASESIKKAAEPVRKYFYTAEIANAVGIHPNTVRLYEELGFLPPIPRSASGYRLFTQAHLEQMRLARIALKEPYTGDKRLAIALVQKAAAAELDNALVLAQQYLDQVRGQQAEAGAAVEFVDRWLGGAVFESVERPLQIGEAARLLGISTDVLRNWDRDGLIDIPRTPQNGYRRYGVVEIGRLRVIKMLRQAGYSMMAVLRMMHALDQGRAETPRHLLDTPPPDEDVYAAADRWLSALDQQELRAVAIIQKLHEMMSQ